MTDESITVRNTTPGRRFLATDTEVKPGEEKTLTGEDVEAAEIFIEKGDFEVLEGEDNVDADPDSEDEETEGSKSQARKGVDADTIIKDLPHLNDEQREKMMDEFDNLQELVEGVDEDYLDDFEDIGSARAEDIVEVLQEQ